MNNATTYQFAEHCYRQWFSWLSPPTSPKLTGCTVLVTGSVGGLGLEAARHLARLGPARIILVVRDVSKAAKAVEAVKAAPFKGEVEPMACDMEDFESVKKFGAQVAALDRLDIAVLNAGIATFPWVVTKDGWERT